MKNKRYQYQYMTYMTSLKIADSVIDFIESLGFTSENKHDPDMIRYTIASIVRQTEESEKTIDSNTINNTLEKDREFKKNVENFVSDNKINNFVEVMQHHS